MDILESVFVGDTGGSRLSVDLLRSAFLAEAKGCSLDRVYTVDPIVDRVPTKHLLLVDRMASLPI